MFPNIYHVLKVTGFYGITNLFLIFTIYHFMYNILFANIFFLSYSTIAVPMSDQPDGIITFLYGSAYS